jgi:hypothetical protein
MMKRVYIFIIVILLFPGFVIAEESAGNFVALRGKTLILRDAQTVEAGLREAILLRDTVETKQASRAKMLFVDDSILTLAENSKIAIKEYFAPEGKKRGKSIISLAEGKLRTLVGNSDFEVYTPTMVVGARGTYFITWIEMEGGVLVSGVTVIEGVVEVFNINPAIAGVVRLERGTMSFVSENKPPAPPKATPPQLLKDLINATELQESPEVEKKPAPIEESERLLQQLPPSTKETLPVTPPFENQPPPGTTPVKIKIPIPEGI